MKSCKHCGLSKPLADFYKHKAMADGHINVCKPCRDIYVNTWNARNKDQRRKIARESGRKVQTSEKRRIVNARLIAKNPNYWNDRAAIRYAKNPGKILARDAARRAMKLQATPAWANLADIELLYRFAQALTKTLSTPFEVDHTVPLKSKYVCGLHVEANLRVIRQLQNRSKNNRHWPDMPASLAA